MSFYIKSTSSVRLSPTTAAGTLGAGYAGEDENQDQQKRDRKRCGEENEKAVAERGKVDLFDAAEKRCQRGNGF